jgi:hypothetical protein
MDEPVDAWWEDGERMECIKEERKKREEPGCCEQDGKHCGV